MDRLKFESSLKSGFFSNVSRGVSLGGSINDARGSLILAVITDLDSDNSGTIVSLVGEDSGLEEVSILSKAWFVWLDDGFLTPGDDPENWTPKLFRVYQDWGTAITNRKEQAVRFNRLSRTLDPERFSAFG